MDPVLLVLSGGQSEYREYMLGKIAERYPIVLLTPDPVTWEREYITAELRIDPADTAEIVATARRAAQRYAVAGVLTYHEPCVELAAVIAAELGVPRCPPQGAARCRDKWATRLALDADGVPSAAAELVTSAAEAAEAAARIGYPVVVKPRSLSASFGVSKVDCPAELEPAFDRAFASGLPEPWEHHSGVLVEEYLDGPEISVDSAVHGGVVESPVFARKVLGYPPHFEELGHVVADPADLVADPQQVRDVVRAAHSALGVDNTVTHTELRLTARGPRLVEVNGRSGGDLIPDLAELATGVDMAAAAADVAAGVPPTLRVVRSRVAGIRFFYTDESGVVDALELDAAEGELPWLHRVTWLVEPGTLIRPEPGRRYFARIGFAVVVAGSVSECEQRMAKVAELVRVRTTGRARSNRR
ncbi:ATP-grasp domain-containing protein [Saccharopolyspora gregorii]|uniref:ATP-grasp domain-containing protein n=1 Tax=Saccharopolyspora gregorii TaxID=33914 RepID=UPI0021ACB18B|nr:ATP-grasp domain-containing protein [Saccharopolyspora gregorii]